MEMTTALKGSQSGRYIFDPTKGRLVMSQRKTTLTGDTGPTAMRMPMTLNSESTVTSRP